MSPQPEHVRRTALRVDGLGVTVGAHRRAAVHDVSFDDRPRRVRRPGRRVRQRQDADLPLGPRPAATRGRGRRRPGPARLRRGRGRPDHRPAPTWDEVRGVRLGAVFQDPASYLNPSLTVGHQLAEQLRGQARAGPRPGPRAQRRAVHRGGAARPGPGLPPVPARALGRHAPTRPDRHRGVAASPSCSSPTRRRPRSTWWCRPRSWSCCRGSGAPTSCRCCSSPTTSPSSPRRATGCW